MSENNRMTIGEIFELLRHGQRREDVALLYRHHYNKMYGVAFSIVKKEDVSQDIVHNVIYKILLLEAEKFPTFNELTWLYTVVKNETLMFLRKDKPKLSLDNMPFGPIVEDWDIRDFVDMEAFYSIIKGLNEERRQIVSLKVLGGYTHREIAKMLGKPIETVQWLYNTSLKKLRVTLSTLLFAILLSGVGSIERLVNYVLQINAVPEIPGQTAHISFDFSVVVFAVLFVVVSVIFWLIFKNSHKIPTKADKKHI